MTCAAGDASFWFVTGLVVSVFALMMLWASGGITIFTVRGRAEHRYARVLNRRVAEYIDLGIDPRQAQAKVESDMAAEAKQTLALRAR